MGVLCGAIKTAHPVYYVRDLNRSIRFYGEKLGLEQAWRFEDYAVAYRLRPGLEIVLAVADSPIDDHDVDQEADRTAIVIVVEHLDTTYQELLDHGVEFTGPIQVKPFGRVATFVDPDGYHFDLCGGQ